MSPRSRSYACVRRRSMKKYAPVAATAPTTSNGGSSHARSVDLSLDILPGFDQVPQAAHGADADAGGFQLRAQARDLHLDRARGKLLVPRGDGPGNAGLADDRRGGGEGEL